MSKDETVHTSETGAQKAGNLERHSLLAPSLRELAEHYGRGSLKYADHNWRKGMDWSLLFDAMMRHAWEFWHGNDYDVGETESKHVIAVAWHALALATFMDEHPDLDDRPQVPVLVSDPLEAMDDVESLDFSGRHARKSDVVFIPGPGDPPQVVYMQDGYFARLVWWVPSGLEGTIGAGAPHVSIIASPMPVTSGE